MPRPSSAAAAADTVFMMAENSQYWPEVMRAQELIRAGAIGEPVSGRGYNFLPFSLRFWTDFRLTLVY